MSKWQRIVKSKLGQKETVLYVFNKIFFSVLRGLPTAIFYRKISWPFFIGKSTRLLHKSKLVTGKYCYIGDFGYLNLASSEGVEFGSNVTIREFCWLQLTSSPAHPGTKIKIGESTYIGPRANIGAAAPLIIGRRCQIGASVSFVAENHEYSGETIFNAGVVRSGIKIGDDCWIGNQVVILDGVTLGDGVVVGAGAVVTKSFESGAVIAGVPAKAIKSRNID